MRELHFDVTGQLLRRNKQCDFENIVRGSDNYLCLVFHFNQEWKETKRVISFYDVDGKQTNEILQFSGTAARARTVVALLLICSQSEAAQPICIAFSNTDVSTSKVLISSNAIGVTGGNEGIITIPRFAGDWGIYRIVFFDKGLSVNVVA